MGDPEPSLLLGRVERALKAADQVYRGFGSRRLAELKKTGGDPVTEVDLALDHVLKDSLLENGEGWLSEETADDSSRLECDLVWIVDPLDGTREFIDGLPEFCTSIAAVVGGEPIAGGVINPAAGIEIVGARGLGVRCNGAEVQAPSRPSAFDEVVASRSEVSRGEWSMVEAAGIVVRPMGSVAYKLARVAVGLDVSTWTPVPKHEWDVAGGAALLRAAGGDVVGLDGESLVFNQAHPWFSGVVAVPAGFEPHLATVRRLIDDQLRGSE